MANGVPNVGHFIPTTLDCQAVEIVYVGLVDGTSFLNAIAEVRKGNGRKRLVGRVKSTKCREIEVNCRDVLRVINGELVAQGLPGLPHHWPTLTSVKEQNYRLFRAAHQILQAILAAAPPLRHRVGSSSYAKRPPIRVSSIRFPRKPGESFGAKPRIHIKDSWSNGKLYISECV